MGTKGPWRTTYPKAPVDAMYSVPGPKYVIPSGLFSASTGRDKNGQLYQSPAYSMANGYKRNDDDGGPGPAAYYPNPKYNNHGKFGGPFAYASWRAKDPLEKDTPSPNAYNTRVKGNVWTKLKAVKGGSMGTRGKGPVMTFGPGPSSYLPELPGGHAALVSGKPKEFRDNGFPGPGTYGESSANKYKKGSPPAFSFGVKHKELFPDWTVSPNTYNTIPPTAKSRKQRPAYSFGAHHSNYRRYMITRADLDGDCDDCGKDDYCKETAPPRPADCPKVSC